MSVHKISVSKSRFVLMASILVIGLSCDSTTPQEDAVTGTDLGKTDVQTEDTASDVVKDVQTSGDTSTVEYPGGVGCECSVDGDCLSGICAETMAGGECASICSDDEDCPDGWKCVPSDVKSADKTGICRDPFANLCLPCMDDDECAPTLGARTGDHICISFNDVGSFCGVPCDAEQGCPNGWDCVSVDAGGTAVDQCVPTDSGACPCTDKFIEMGATTACLVTNEFGSCPGNRTCDSECDGPAPQAETCNNADEDCDGQTDEDVDGTVCTIKNTFGTCEGNVVCEDGVSRCEGEEATAETCDGLDNDCDGNSDEGFSNIDGDQYADCMDDDRDGDTVQNDLDNCPDIKNTTQANHDDDSEGDACDGDDDNDNIVDALDNCDFVKNPYQENMNGDSDGDACDCDIDGDGVPNLNPDCEDSAILDNCPTVANSKQENVDNDELGDACDCDIDGDGVFNANTVCDEPSTADNCAYVCNHLQENLDLDTMGDACDPDDDADTIPDLNDNCPTIPNTDQANIDNDAFGDLCDDDKDGDGYANAMDNCPATANPGQEDRNDNQIGDACESDWDGDGKVNTRDNCPWVANLDQTNMDGDAFGDACDCDIDGDGVNNENPDCATPLPADNCPLISNGSQLNHDSDALGDVCDPDIDNDGDPNETDCDPYDATVGHDEPETCNEVDDDCDGETDEGDAGGCETYYLDTDGDHYGVEDNECLCGATGDYSATLKGDCNDDNDSVHPEAGEYCNHVDDDCDGSTDEEGAVDCTTYYRDGDLDGFGLASDPRCVCNMLPLYTLKKGGDCNDANNNVNPDATEKCNSIDDNCNGLTDEEDSEGCDVYYPDGDHDGFGDRDEPACLCAIDATHTLTIGGDCDDQTPSVNPSATEKCNEIDDNCNDLVDEAGAEDCINYYTDTDRDNYGANSTAICMCEATETHQTPNGGDCDEGDASRNPGVVETCNNIDDDCDGLTDEDGADGCSEYYLDTDNDEYGSAMRCLCEPGDDYTATSGGDCNDDNSQVNPGAGERCNSIDDDCDGSTDEDGASDCVNRFIDFDNDTYGQVDSGRCLCGTDPAYDATRGGDCDDDNSAINPGILETCTDMDDDCDGLTDPENSPGCTPYNLDEDRDGYGTFVTKCLCEGTGEYDVKNASDCDDSSELIHPGAEEHCNLLDDDCDSFTDEAGAADCVIFFEDSDRDTYGDPDSSMCLCGPYTPYTALEGTDCNDGDSTTNPNSTEVCDSKDNNCDGTTDEEGATDCLRRYPDVDGDGYGAKVPYRCLCQNEGYYKVSVTGDCNDNDEDINPMVSETCNGVDDNCDGITDPPGAPNCVHYYKDEDTDTWGSSEAACLCAKAPPYSAVRSGDCLDTNASVNPDGTETCNGIDDNCNNQVDEWLSTDADSDGHYTPTSCATPNDDCNDSNPQIRPGLGETCDGLDNDCDGTTDPAGSTNCVNRWLDADRDGYGTGDMTCWCTTHLPTGWTATQGGDCYDNSDSALPTQSNFFSAHRGDGSFDYDCNSVEERMPAYNVKASCEWNSSQYKCVGTAGFGTIPACGQTGSWKTDCKWKVSEQACIYETEEVRTMSCR